MAKIVPVEFPLNLGTANELIVRATPFSLEDVSVHLFYEFWDETLSPTAKLLNSGRINVPESIYRDWGLDNMYLISWVAQQLGVTLITETIVGATGANA